MALRHDACVCRLLSCWSIFKWYEYRKPFHIRNQTLYGKWLHSLVHAICSVNFSAQCACRVLRRNRGNILKMFIINASRPNLPPRSGNRRPSLVYITQDCKKYVMSGQICRQTCCIPSEPAQSSWLPVNLLQSSLVQSEGA